MTDYFGGHSRDELENLLRRLVEQGAEGPKLDFKTTLDLDSKASQAELAKDISSIANTDDAGRLDDIGYIIVGAQRGRIIGSPLLAADPDKLQARLTDLIKNLVGPLPQFSLVIFEEPGLDRWGAIVIPPSTQQPHVHVRDASGVTKHEWFVRVNDTTERASPHDYTRMLAKGIRREVRPLEIELQRLALRLEQRGSPNLESIAEVLRGVSVSSVAAETKDEGDLASRIRGKLVQNDSAIEDALVTEALRLWTVMSESTDANPWSFRDRSPEQIRGILTYLEEQSAPLAMSLATIARYDQSGRYTAAACRALAIIARLPEPVGAHFPQAAEFRLYPLVLCLYALVTIAAKEQRVELLKQVLALQLEDGDHSEPIIAVFRRVRASYHVFHAVHEQKYVDPIPVRVRDEFIPRLSSLLTGTPARDAFRLAEFVAGLAFLSVSMKVWGDKVPLPGIYLYEYEARRSLTRFLRGRPDWISDVLGVPMTQLLTDFDAGAFKVVNRAGCDDGFIRGALKAYEGE